VWLFLFLYGATCLIGGFLTTFWARVAWQRCKVIDHFCLKDRAFVLASAIAIVAGGVAVIDGARVFGNAEYGLSSILKRGEAWFIGAGLIISYIGFLKMTWLADLEKHPPKWTWTRSMIGLTILWAVIALLLAPGVPFKHG
jgi:hypothetical protein